MSAEADQLDREAQRHDDEANRLYSTAPQVEADGGALASIVSTLRTPFLQSVGNNWVGPHADKFLNGAQARYERFSRNQSILNEVASSMRRRADWLRQEARRKRDRANQLRREEEERNRQRS